MKTKYFPLFIGMVAAVIAFLSLYGSGEDYIKNLLNERKKKDKELKKPDSPLSPEKRARFKGLNYYPPKLEYRIEARFVPDTSQPVIQMATSTGKTRKFKIIGKAFFQIDGQEVSLEIYASLGADYHLFVPFMDKTSGRETYGGGRYLDVEAPKANKIILDFNRAYSPYCAYSDQYDCPKPPQANWLPIAIEAGEKNLEL